jgi:hypothetical protein
MFKALGAFVFGLLAVLSVGYLVIRKQEDQSTRNTIDTFVGGKVSSIRAKAHKAKEIFVEFTTNKPEEMVA